MLTDDPGPFADAQALILECFSALVPPERLALSAYAARHRRLTKGFGEESRPFDPAVAPYLAGPSDALTSGDYTTVVIPGPGQCAKTTIAENWFQLSVETDPADFLWFMQTHPGVQSYVKDRIDPMILAHPAMSARLGGHAVDDSLAFKNFGVMRAEFLSFTRTNLIGKNAPRIVADEVDNYDDGEMGEAKQVLDIRRQVYGADSCLLMMSHPDRATHMDPGKCQRGIMAVYAHSTRHTWWWPCPSCGAHSSPCPGTARHMVLDYPEKAPLDEVADLARLVCPTCGALIEDRQRRAMNAAGRWVGRGEEIDGDGRVTGRLIATDTAGWWIVGAMSPFVLGGIGGLAREKAKAERKVAQDGDDATLRQVIVKQWGLPYVPTRKVGSTDGSTLADRAESGLQEDRVPEWVRFVTVAADVQASRFEVLRRGWGVDGESVVISAHRIVADTATDAQAWDRMLDVMQAPILLADGSGRVMRPRAVSTDMGGAAGVTSSAYAAWLRWRAVKKARLLGQLDGRHLWDVLLTQGASNPQATRLQVVYPDDVRKDRKASAIARGQVPVARFNSNQFKDDLANQLQRPLPGAWYVHLPAFLKDAAGPPHPWFEQLVSERRSPTGRWEKPTGSTRNEAADLMVMTHVLARLHGLGRIDWTNPPAWAAPWDSNAMVEMPGSEPATAPPIPTGRAPQAGAGKRSYFARQDRGFFKR